MNRCRRVAAVGKKFHRALAMAACVLSEIGTNS